MGERLETSAVLWAVVGSFPVTAFRVRMTEAWVTDRSTSLREGPALRGLFELEVG